MELTALGIGFGGLQILVGLLLADFLTGLIHWFEDRYGNPEWPFVGEAIRANHEHHRTPRAFLAGGYFSRNKEVLIGTSMILVMFAALSILNLITASAVIFGFFANEFHAAAHRFPRENPVFVRGLQKLGFMQSFQHHARHHRGQKNSSYCVMTNFVNPVLDAIFFFPGLEWIISQFFGISPRLDPTVRRGHSRTTHTQV